IDPDPLLGGVTDQGAIRKLGDEGVLAMICDSTNVFVDGSAGSESDVRVAITKLIGALKGKIAADCFASNVARMDTIIRAAPGNEVAIRTLQNALADRGVRLYTERDHPGIHVSGHPCRDELKEMYQWARPRIAVPTHGERRHLLEHLAFAKDMQVPEAIAPRN